MGEKSRGNYKIGFCMKTDCTNRDKKCNGCVRFSEYVVKPKPKKD